MTLDEWATERVRPNVPTPSDDFWQGYGAAIEDFIDTLSVDGYRVVKLEHCQDTADGYTVNYGAWNVLEELT